ncbi:MFS transporter [Thermomicrobium sp. 4228-Ro]|uniref:MFS transporter n=1 Tax=Thermomicrobium sp. 4228-Ro TaxID=2993937 RepID=UPI002248E834|nr:MFS transporter [Thermomicrobium sp. 4228-Ro]MCX2727571.1 MFS transporter [Thermomicrobium sp. 4228-Ro]
MQVMQHVQVKVPVGSFWVLRLLLFASFFDLFVQYPIAAPYASALGASPALVGAIVAAYSVSNLLGNVVAGIALDRFGRFPLLVAGALTTAAVVAAYTLARTPAQLLSLRLLHGLTVAALAPGTFALSGDLAQGDRRARAMGANGAVIALAAIIAPALAGIVQERTGFATVFLLDALVLAVAGSLVLAAGRSLRRLESARGGRAQSPSSALTALRALTVPYGALLLFAFALGTFVTGLPEQLHALGIAPSIRGAAFSTYGLVAAGVMVSPIASRLIRRAWRLGTAIGSLSIAIGLGLAGTGSAVSTVERAVLSGAAFFGLGFGFLFPALTTEVARRTEPGQRGRAFGVFYALYSLGVIGGSLVAGWLSERAGADSGWPLWIGAAVALCGVAFPLLERCRSALPAA